MPGRFSLQGRAVRLLPCAARRRPCSARRWQSRSRAAMCRAMWCASARQRERRHLWRQCRQHGRRGLRLRQCGAGGWRHRYGAGFRGGHASALQYAEAEQHVVAIKGGSLSGTVIAGWGASPPMSAPFPGEESGGAGRQFRNGDGYGRRVQRYVWQCHAQWRNPAGRGRCGAGHLVRRGKHNGECGHFRACLYACAQYR